MGPVEQELRETADCWRINRDPGRPYGFMAALARGCLSDSARTVLKDAAVSSGHYLYAPDVWSEAIEAAAELGL
jgi:hypothetical protein